MDDPENAADEELLLESLDPIEDDGTETSDARAEDRTFKSDAELPVYMRPFANSIFPVLLVDKNLQIRYANPVCNRLFAPYVDHDHPIVSDILRKALGLEALKEVRRSMEDRSSGFSWRGTARSKSRDTGTIQTKVYMFPAFAGDRDPTEFIIFFDDVTEENKNMLRSVFVSLLEASKLKDNDTGKHIQRVNVYSQNLSKELYHRPEYQAIDMDFIDDIGFLASMHDVGKIGTPDDILNKEGPLSEWEWSVMREHTKNGAFILSTYPNPMAREIALNHHERWDGTGYPFQLEGTMIPLSARIVAIADVYDALRMRRSYKEPFDHGTARSKILEAAGRHFDPSLVEVFLAIEDSFERTYEDYAD